MADKIKRKTEDKQTNTHTNKQKQENSRIPSQAIENLEIKCYSAEVLESRVAIQTNNFDSVRYNTIEESCDRLSNRVHFLDFLVDLSEYR